MLKKPKYWDSWRGEVLRAIVFDGASEWKEIRNITGFSQRKLWKVMGEMIRYGVIDVVESGGEKKYQLANDELYKAYQAAKPSDDKQNDKPSVFTSKTPSDHAKWIQSWIEQDDINASLESKHFFLEGTQLAYLTRRLIERAQDNIMIVNPFVDRAGLGTAFRETMKKDVKGLLITREPEDDEQKKEFHQTLIDAGCELYYSGSVGGVHSKIVVIDNDVAIVSSMNFTKNAEAAVSHETGIVSLDQDVVESVMESIRNLRDQDETITV
ncbi:MAG: phospholipase D-like domain-containing protein [Candidatus Thorarchaeota archaeon]